MDVLLDWNNVIRLNTKVLHLIGLWPSGNHVYKYDFYTFYAFFLVNILYNGHNFFQVCNIFVVYNSMEALTETIFITGKDVLGMVKIMIFVKNLGLLKNIIGTLNSEKFKITNLKQKQLVQPHITLWKYCFYLWWIPVVPTVFFLLLYPLLDGSYKNYQLPCAAWYPFRTNYTPAYEITYVYQFLGLWFVACATINTDSLLIAMFMALGAHSDILASKLRNLQDDSKVSYSKKFIHCVKHHKSLIK